VSAPARGFVTAAATAIVLPALLAMRSATAVAGGPVDQFDWWDGGQTNGYVETDQSRQQVTASITAGDVPAQSDGRNASGPAATCVWKPWAQVSASLIITQAGGMMLPDGPGPGLVLYARVCADGTVTDWQWFRVADQAAAVAAARDDVRRRLPAPQAVLSPDPAAGLVVRVATWFAVPAAQWAPVRDTATALGESVTVTATPDTLTFDPGDGATPVSCAGPGPTFVPGAAVPSTPPACSYTYRDASTAAPDGQHWQAALSVRWQVTWTASNGQTGTLDPIVTTTPLALTVQEYEAIERTG